MRNPNQRWSIAAAVLSVVLLGGLSAEAGEKVDLKKQVTRDAVIRVTNVAGSVKLIGWNKDELSVTGVIGPGVEKVDISGEPDHVQVRVVLQREHGDGDADLTIHVPDHSRPRVELVSASLEVIQLQGSFEGETVSGSIKVDDSALKEVSLKTVSGSIRVTGVSDRVQLKAVSGDITAKEVGGEASAENVSGAIQIQGREFTRASLKSVSGSIRFDGALKGDGSFAAESHSGNVDLMLPASTSATFDISSFSGTIVSELGGGEGTRKGFGPGRESHFTVGQDGARVSLKTFSGNVHLKKR